MNPIVMTEVMDLLISKLEQASDDDDVSIVHKNFVSLVSIVSAVSMYFHSTNDLKSKSMVQVIRMLHLSKGLYK